MTKVRLCLIQPLPPSTQRPTLFRPPPSFWTHAKGRRAAMGGRRCRARGEPSSLFRLGLRCLFQESGRAKGLDGYKRKARMGQDLLTQCGVELSQPGEHHLLEFFLLTKVKRGDLRGKLPVDLFRSAHIQSSDHFNLSSTSANNHPITHSSYLRLSFRFTYAGRAFATVAGPLQQGRST